MTLSLISLSLLVLDLMAFILLALSLRAPSPLALGLMALTLMALSLMAPPLPTVALSLSLPTVDGLLLPPSHPSPSLLPALTTPYSPSQTERPKLLLARLKSIRCPAQTPFFGP